MSVPEPFEDDGRLDVVLVTQLGSRRALLGGGGARSVHLQTYESLWISPAKNERSSPSILCDGRPTYGTDFGVAWRVGFGLVFFLLLLSTLVLHLSERDLAVFFLLLLLLCRQIKPEHFETIFDTTAAPGKRENVSIPAGLLALLDTLWERMVAIQPSTSTDANFLNSKTGMRFLH